jgi:hypothetical protein
MTKKLLTLSMAIILTSGAALASHGPPSNARNLPTHTPPPPVTSYNNATATGTNTSTVTGNSTLGGALGGSLASIYTGQANAGGNSTTALNHIGSSAHPTAALNAGNTATTTGNNSAYIGSNLTANGSSFGVNSSQGNTNTNIASAANKITGPRPAVGALTAGNTADSGGYNSLNVSGNATTDGSEMDVTNSQSNSLENDMTSNNRVR